MTEDNKKLAESIRSGKYFAEARLWFQAVYIGPIPERSFFLIIAVLSILVSFFSFNALTSLMPLTSRVPILIHSGDRPDEVQPSLVQIEKGSRDNNPAIASFFVKRYVQAREGYLYQSFAGNALFIRSQSSEAVYAAYANAYNPANPESPLAPLGENGQRIVTLKTIRHDYAGDSGTAEVEFAVETLGVGEPNKTQWTAKMEYRYRGMTTKEEKNAETGKKELAITDPQFQVVNYVLEKNQ